MEKSDIAKLVLNSIKDARTTIDNYAFFNATDPDGLCSDFADANGLIGSFNDYYKGKSCIGGLLHQMHSYYEPYVAVFEEEETADMKKAKRAYDILLPGTALSTVITAFESGFFPVALTMGTFSLVVYIAIKTRQWERKRQWKAFKKYDDEAKSMGREGLLEVLDSEKESILEALSNDCSYKSED